MKNDIYQFSFSLKISMGGLVQMWLDSYDDIFSDFEPRPFSTRMWSDDFIFQIRKVKKEHPKKVTALRILFPEKVRKESVDKILAEGFDNLVLLPPIFRYFH